MNDRISLPKDRIRILLLEGIADSAVDLFGGAGYATIQREMDGVIALVKAAALKFD